MADYPSLDELIKAKRAGGGLGAGLQAGLEGLVAGHKQKVSEEQQQLENALAQAKQKLLEEKQAGELITPEEQVSHRTETPATPEKIKALTPKKPVPTFRQGPNGELLQVHVDADGQVTGTTPLTGPRTAQVPAQQAEQFGDFKTLADQLQKVKDSYNPEFVGPVAGRAGKLAQIVDIPGAGLGASPERSNFLSNVNSIRNQLIYLRSGKQINEKEYERLLQELPDENKSKVDFEAKLVNFENVFKEIAQNKQKALQEGGFRNVPSTVGDNEPAKPQKRSFTVKSITKVPGK